MALINKVETKLVVLQPQKQKPWPHERKLGEVFRIFYLIVQAVIILLFLFHLFLLLHILLFLLLFLTPLFSLFSFSFSISFPI